MIFCFFCFFYIMQCELFQESGVAELVSAMAAGWNAQLIVETWSQGGLIATSVGLAIASRLSCGRHVCLVQDEQSRAEYEAAMGEAGVSTEVIVGEAEDVMSGLSGVDFLVVDCRRRDFQRVLRVAKLGHRGAVLICKNANSTNNLSLKWRSVLDPASRVVRTVFLPVGKGLDIAHVAAAGASSGSKQGESRWIRHFDQQSGEEFVIRN